MSRPRLLPLLPVFAALLAASPLPAPPLDAGQRADRLASRRAAAAQAPVNSPADSVVRWQGQAAPEAPRVDTPAWREGDRRARVDGARALQPAVSAPRVVERGPVKPGERSAVDGATWDRGGLRVSNRWIDPERKPRLVQDAPVVTVSQGSRQAKDLADELSLADINRFQFRRGRSTEAGLPAEPAGGATPPGDQESSGGTAPERPRSP